MLVELHIQNIALIESLTLATAPGLTVFTGETGAGKSLLIDAVQAVLGGRVSADLIRTGCDRAVVEAVFDIADVPAAAALLSEWDLYDPAEPLLVVTRELSRSGRHTARINRRAVPAAMVRQLTSHLVDLCGQHEHQSLLQAEQPRRLLDAYGGDAIASPRQTYAGIWQELQAVRTKLAALSGDSHARDIDLLRYQRDEIDEARLQVGEDRELLQQRELLHSASRRKELAVMAYMSLAEGSEAAPAAIDRAGAAVAALQELAALDQEVAATLETVTLAVDELLAASRTLRQYAETVDADPGQLAYVMERLDLLARLRRKYGDSIEEILAYRDDVAAKLDDLEHAAERLEELQQAETQLVAQLEAAAAKLSQARTEAAAALSEAATAAVRRLGMPNAVISFRVEQVEPGPAGADEVLLLFSANPGEPQRPVARVASGGELSRLTLALRTVTAAIDGVGTLIFDEVDGGISGAAAQAVAEEMAALAAHRQVFAVSHLVQMAAMADQHVHISKAVHAGRTYTAVNVLDSDAERAEELARLVSGSKLTATTFEHALELLTTSRERKRKLRQQADVS